MFVIPTADDLVTFIQDFTGSSNVNEIKKCVFMAEMSMRNIELPALRSDPYAPENIGVVDRNGRIPIPGDMNKPILFFKQGSQYVTQCTCSGTSGSNILNLVTNPNQSLGVGMYVTGNNIVPGSTIVSFPQANQVMLSIPLTGTFTNEDVVFNTGGSNSSQTGPWIVYDRIGDRDIITQGMIAQLYLQPVNVPAVIRGKFSEVAQWYEFLPYVAEGDLINMYYYKAWPLLFSPAQDQLLSTTGTVGTPTGFSPWTVQLTVSDTTNYSVGATLTATNGTGSLGSGTVTVVSIDSSTQLTVTVAGSSPTPGTVTNITQIDITVQNNAVLSTWPEGYVYATLREYYIKRHNSQDAAIYQAKFDEAWQTIEDQNNKGKWSGGNTRLSSIWQPRQYRQYNIK